MQGLARSGKVETFRESFSSILGECQVRLVHIGTKNPQVDRRVIVNDPEAAHQQRFLATSIV